MELLITTVHIEWPYRCLALALFLNVAETKSLVSGLRSVQFEFFMELRKKCALCSAQLGAGRNAARNWSSGL